MWKKISSVRRARLNEDTAVKFSFSLPNFWQFRRSCSLHEQNFDTRKIVGLFLCHRYAGALAAHAVRWRRTTRESRIFNLLCCMKKQGRLSTSKPRLSKQCGQNEKKCEEKHGCQWKKMFFGVQFFFFFFFFLPPSQKCFANSIKHPGMTKTKKKKKKSEKHFLDKKKTDPCSVPNGPKHPEMER